MVANKAPSQENRIERGLPEVLAYKRGEWTGCRVHTYEMVVPDVREVRKALGLSQRNFALEFGFAVSAVRDWEKAKRFPEKSARILLTLIAKDVELVRSAICETVRHVSTEQF